MAVVTGKLSDFGLQSLVGKAPIITFTASSAGIKDGRLFSTTPIRVTPAADGSFTVTLEPTDGIMPEVWYRVSIEHLQPGGEYTHYDVLELRVFVPEGYNGPISGLPGSPLSPYTVLVSLDPPPPGYKGWWLYSPAAGQTMPLDDPRIGDLRMF